MKPEELENNLDQFIGGEEFYRHGLMRNFIYTEGVKYLADNAGAYWLIDVVASHQTSAKVRREEFQVWKLFVMSAKSAYVVLEDGNLNEIMRQDIEYTDFPLKFFKLYVVNGVLMLPGEY